MYKIPPRKMSSKMSCTLKRDFGDKNCCYHPDFPVIFECENCENQLVCQECVPSYHYGHSFKHLRDAVTEKQSEIKEFISQCESHIEKLSNTVVLIKKQCEKMSINYECNQATVNMHTSKLLSLIEKERKQIVSTLDHKQQLSLKPLQDLKSELKCMIEVSEKGVSEYENTLTSSEICIYKKSCLLNTSPKRLITPCLFTLSTVCNVKNASTCLNGKLMVKQKTCKCQIRQEIKSELKLDERVDSIHAIRGNKLLLLLEHRNVFLIIEELNIIQRRELQIILETFYIDFEGFIVYVQTTTREIVAINIENLSKQVLFKYTHKPSCIGTWSKNKPLDIIYFLQQDSEKAARLFIYTSEGKVQKSTSLTAEMNKNTSTCILNKNTCTNNECRINPTTGIILILLKGSFFVLDSQLNVLTTWSHHSYIELFYCMCAYVDKYDNVIILENGPYGTISWIHDKSVLPDQVMYHKNFTLSSLCVTEDDMLHVVVVDKPGEHNHSILSISYIE